jgi:hypothetical protein
MVGKTNLKRASVACLAGVAVARAVQVRRAHRRHQGFFHRLVPH